MLRWAFPSRNATPPRRRRRRPKPRQNPKPRRRRKPPRRSSADPLLDQSGHALQQWPLQQRDMADDAEGQVAERDQARCRRLRNAEDALAELDPALADRLALGGVA